MDEKIIVSLARSAWKKEEEHARKNQIRQFSVSWNRFLFLFFSFSFVCITGEPLMIINVWLWMTKVKKKSLETPECTTPCRDRASISAFVATNEKKWKPKKVCHHLSIISSHSLYVFLCLSPSSSFSDVSISRWINLYTLCWTRF